MSKHLLVTVIVPAYNCELTIAQTLNALLKQEYKNIEIIVVNDGSKDETLNILQYYRDQIILINQENSGVAVARNTGIRAAKGELISFCDADDIWSAGKVSAQVAYLKNKPELQMIYCDWHVWYPNEDGKFIIPKDFNLHASEMIEIIPDKSGWIYHKLLLDCICLTSTVIMRRELIESLGYFDTSLKCGEDYDYWLRASRITEIDKLKAKYVLYRQHPQSITHMPNKFHYELAVLNKAILTWGAISPNGERNNPAALKERLAKMKFDFGYSHYRADNYTIAIKSLLDAIAEKPIWYLPWAYISLCFFKKITMILHLNIRQSEN